MSRPTLGTTLGKGCSKVPYANCQDCINAQGWKIVHSCKLNVGVPHPERKFDGGMKNHCSRCPFPDGCMTCAL